MSDFIVGLWCEENAFLCLRKSEIVAVTDDGDGGRPVAHIFLNSPLNGHTEIEMELPGSYSDFLTELMGEPLEVRRYNEESIMTEVTELKELIYTMRTNLRYEMDEEVKKDILSGATDVLRESQRKFDALREIELIVITKLEE